MPFASCLRVQIESTSSRYLSTAKERSNRNASACGSRSLKTMFASPLRQLLTSYVVDDETIDSMVRRRLHPVAPLDNDVASRGGWALVEWNLHVDVPGARRQWARVEACGFVDRERGRG